jgi:hypothetical protein
MALVLLGALGGAAFGGLSGYALGGLAGAALTGAAVGGLAGATLGGLAGAAAEYPYYWGYHPHWAPYYHPCYYSPYDAVAPRAYYAYPSPWFAPAFGYW